MGLPEPDKGTGPLAGPAVHEVVVEVAHDALGHLLHASLVLAELAEGGPALDHIAQGELRQVEHGPGPAPARLTTSPKPVTRLGNPGSWSSARAKPSRGNGRAIAPPRRPPGDRGGTWHPPTSIIAEALRGENGPGALSGRRGAEWTAAPGSWTAPPDSRPSGWSGGPCSPAWRFSAGKLKIGRKLC